MLAYHEIDEHILFNFLCFCKHILNKDAVATGGVVHQNVGHGADELAVLENGAAAHECVNIGPTMYLQI